MSLPRSLGLTLAALLLAGSARALPPPIRIMPLGDSITYGSSTPAAPGGYRLPLYIALTNLGYNVDYVGSTTGNSAPGLGAEINHEGHGGWRISDPSVGLYENIYGWFESIEDPHVVLVHIGTNDSGGMPAFTNAYVRLEALIDRIARCQPSAKIIVTSLMKRLTPNYSNITNYFNPFVPLVVAHQQSLGRSVTFLDMHAYLELSDMNDNLHPNSVGYAKMAAAWLPAVTNIIGTNVVANQPAPIRGVGNLSDRTSATVSFNKPVSPETATNAANYAIDGGLSVLSATLSGSRRTVTLTTSLQAPLSTYTVTMTGIADETAPAALTIPAGSQVTFTSAVPPVVLSASGASSLTQADLYFSKTMDRASATNAANYAVNNGLSVLGASLSADRRTVTLTTSLQQAGASYTVTCSNLRDETAPEPLTIAAGSQASFSGYVAPPARGYWNYVPESADYAPVYMLDLTNYPNYSAGVPYTVDNSAAVGSFDRVAYYLEQQKPGQPLQYVWVSMDAFTNRADKLGVPNATSGETYQQYVANLNIACNVPGVATGAVSVGNIEFWPFNYTSTNAKGIPGASGSLHDFGDQCSFSGNYGCMQVHNTSAGQTVLAVNHWNASGVVEVGIGSQPASHPDWTFSNNGTNLLIKTLWVLVRRDRSDVTPPAALSAVSDFSRQLVAVSFSEPLDAASVTPSRFSIDNGVQVTEAALQADGATVYLTTTPLPLNAALTLAISDVRDRSPNANATAPGTALPVAVYSVPQPVAANVGAGSGEPAAGYELVYALDVPATGKFNSLANPYRFNRSDAPGAFDRVAYYLELTSTNGATQYVWASMDAFTADRKKIGVPTAASGAVWQRAVANLDVKSNVPGVTEGTGLAGGSLEFWASNYSQTNTAAVPGASNATFDFGDSGGTATAGHGCMQVHNYLAGQTLFALNNWGSDNQPLAVGIGNQPTGNPDWTHAGNAGAAYTKRTLYVLVRPVSTVPTEVAANVPESAGYQLLYTVGLPVRGGFNTNSAAFYLTNNYTNSLASPFSRVAYYLELQSGAGPTQWLWTAMDAFTFDARRLGVPTNNCVFQQKVTRLDVRSNVGGIVQGNNIDTGNIEFWPQNFGGANALPIPGAHNVNCDFGDSRSTSGTYGSMQVHNYGAGATQTLFAVNHFNDNNLLCLGIGNCPSPALSGSAYGIDWTFKDNAASYNHRRLHVFVLPIPAGSDTNRPALLNAQASLTLDEVAVGFSEPLADTAASPALYTLSGGASVTGAWLSPNRRDVILRTSPLAAGQSYAVTVSGVADASPTGNLVAPGSSVAFTAPTTWPAGVYTNVAESAEYEVLAYLAVSNTTQYANGAQYLFDESRFQRARPFDRVAYCLELVTNGVHKWVWVSMDAFTNDLSMIAVPTADRGDPFIQTYVSNLNVFAFSSDGAVAVTTGVGIASGNIEFWSSNYGNANAKSIPGASATLYDFGDDRGANRGAGHGSMQVHNYLQGHTILSLVKFGANGAVPGLGIGNNPAASNDPDWTFNYNARTYSTKNLYILARRGNPSATSGARPDLWNQPQAQTVSSGQPAFFSAYTPNAVSYQWRKDGAAIAGATAPWLEIPSAHLVDAGVYDVVVYGSGTAYTVSRSAVLTVQWVGLLLRIE